MEKNVTQIEFQMKIENMSEYYKLINEIDSLRLELCRKTEQLRRFNFKGAIKKDTEASNF